MEKTYNIQNKYILYIFLIYDLAENISIIAAEVNASVQERICQFNQKLFALKALKAKLIINLIINVKKLNNVVWK